MEKLVSNYRSMVVKAFLTTGQVAKRLNESQRTIARWCEQGFFKEATKSNPYNRFSHWRIPLEAVEEFEKDRSKK